MQSLAIFHAFWSAYTICQNRTGRPAGQWSQFANGRFVSADWELFVAKLLLYKNDLFSRKQLCRFGGKVTRFIWERANLTGQFCRAPMDIATRAARPIGTPEHFEYATNYFKIIPKQRSWFGVIMCLSKTTFQSVIQILYKLSKPSRMITHC